MRNSSILPAVRPVSQAPCPARSLAPDREYATPPDRLCATVLDANSDSSLAATFAQGMATIARAVAEHFPDNIYGDVDFLSAALVARFGDQPAAEAQLTVHCEQIAGLIALYGCHSAIRFRYMHDFLYGFDWARWVRKDPINRAATGPFDPVFLQYLYQRGGELLALIERGDAEYPPLAPDQWRNPFDFSREPAAEARLHRLLAAEELLPLAAWDICARPSFDRDFHRLRRERATHRDG